jgi:hypothetical protein
MAVMHLESLVLRCMPVAGGLVAGMVRLGSNPADGQASARLTHPRHPSQSRRQAAYQGSRRYDFTEHLREDRTADRAGRPLQQTGVQHRCPASPAGRAIQTRWPGQVRGPRPTAVWCASLTAGKHRTTVGRGK